MLKKLVAPVVITGALLGGVVGGASAYAAAPPSTPAAATAHSGKHTLQSWLRDHRVKLRREGVAISAKTIGVTPKALVTELKTGKSVAQVAGEHNVTAQTVVNALDRAATAKIDKAVTKHRLTQTEASKIDALLPKYLTTAVDKVR